jgi:hypothetical protein
MVEGESRVLGRQRPCDILVVDELISRKHAMLKIRSGEAILTDLGSSNGSYISGARLKKQQPYKLQNYFVLGSTIFKVVPTEPECFSETWSINATELNALKRLSFFEQAQAVAKSHPVMNMAHLLYGLLATQEERLKPILDKVGSTLTANSLKHKLDHHHIFSKPHEWLNSCLKNLTLITKPSFLLITPKVREQIMAFNDHQNDWPEQMLYRILKDFHNLGVISLDLPANATAEDTMSALQEEARPITAKMTVIDPNLNVTKKKTRETVSWSADFWNQFEELLRPGNSLLLTSSAGAGKTSLLRVFAKKKARYFDFRSFFMVSRDPGDLEHYIGEIQVALTHRKWVIVDHLDYLVDHGDIGIDLLGQLGSSSAPFMGIVSRKNLSRFQKLCKSLQHYDLDFLIKPELEQCYGFLIRDFQNKAKRGLTHKAFRYLEERVIAKYPYNLGLLHEFLSLALLKLQATDPLLSKEEAEKDLDESIFEQVLVQSFATSGANSIERESLKKRREELGIAPTSTSSSGLRERAILKNVENLIQEYARNLWKVEIEYSDGSKQLDDQIHLTRDQKLEELGKQLGIIFTLQQESFQKWYQQFIYEMEPGNIEQDVGSVRQYKQLWQTYRKRMDKMTPDLVQDLYNRLCGELLERALYQPTSKLPPLDEGV